MVTIQMFTSISVLLCAIMVKGQIPVGSLPRYLVNNTQYGTLATQWNQVAQLAVQRNASGPINAAATYFILHQCMLLTRNEMKATNQNQLSRLQTAVSYAAYQALQYQRPESVAYLREKFAQLTAAGVAGLNPNLVGATTPASSPQAVANRICSAAWALRASTFLTGGRGNNPFPFTSTNPFLDPRVPTDPSTVIDINKWQPLQLAARQPFLGQAWYTADGYAATPRDMQLPVDGAPVPNLPYYNAENINKANSEWWSWVQEIVTLSGQLDDYTKTIAEFWSAGPGTSFPAGMWNWFCQLLALTRNQSLDTDLNMYYAVNAALFDASVAAWTQKRLSSGYRPISAVRYAFAGQTIGAWGGTFTNTVGPIDGSQFWPYQPTSLPSPPFPGWVSGHSTFSSAAATALRLFYGGNDTMNIQVVIPPGSSLVEPGIAPTTKITLVWTTFSDAAAEAGFSRVLGGIHVTPDNTAGLLLGETVGNLSYFKARQYFSSTSSRDRASTRPSMGAVLLDPKAATEEDLVAVCEALVAECKASHLKILRGGVDQQIEAAKVQAQEQVRARREVSVPDFSPGYDDYDPSTSCPDGVCSCGGSCSLPPNLLRNAAPPSPPPALQIPDPPSSG